jgi:hypothetical protein
LTARRNTNRLSNVSTTLPAMHVEYQAPSSSASSALSTPHHSGWCAQLIYWCICTTCYAEVDLRANDSSCDVVTMQMCNSFAECITTDADETNGSFADTAAQPMTRSMRTLSNATDVKVCACAPTLRKCAAVDTGRCVEKCPAAAGVCHMGH